MGETDIQQPYAKKKKKNDAGQAAINAIVLAETKLWKDEARNH